jgi:hypothetical protein
MAKKPPCSCYSCKNTFTRREWNKQNNSLINDHGYRFTQNLQLDIFYNSDNDGLCRTCFKNYLSQDIELHLN